MTKTKQVLDLIKIRAGVDDAYIHCYSWQQFPEDEEFRNGDLNFNQYILAIYDKYPKILWQLVWDLYDKLWGDSFKNKIMLFTFISQEESDRLDWLIENLK